MNRPALISVFSDQRRTKSTTRSRTSCGTHTLVRAPQDFFLRPCAQPSIRPAPHPSSGSSFPGTRSVVVRLGGPDGSWTGRQPPRSRRTLFANGRTPLAAAPVPHTDRKPALYPANAVLGCQPSLRQCSASALFACVLSVILTEERSLQFQLRQDNSTNKTFANRFSPRFSECPCHRQGAQVFLGSHVMNNSTGNRRSPLREIAWDDRITANKEVAVWAGRRRARLRPTWADFIQVSLNVS